jgi:hypothetical protein
MEPEGSLPNSQESATYPYPEPGQSSPWPHSTLCISILILSSHLCPGLPIGLFPSGFPTEPLLSHIHATSPAQVRTMLATNNSIGTSLFLKQIIWITSALGISC